MKVALIQFSIIWEDAVANRNLITAKIEALPQGVALIVLPEMFTTGFTMQPERVAETMQGPTVNWMQAVAKKTDAAICGSVVISENDVFRNRCLFVFPSGDIEYYDKRHLFTMAGENKVYAPGKEKMILSYKNWKICLQVCYDLRFPVFSRNTEDYDLLLYVANWPQPRISAWDALLKARAIENMCWVIGVNRIGEDQNNNRYPGHSQVLDCFGEVLVQSSDNEGIFMADIDLEHIMQTRKKLPFLNDRDDFTVN